jgi:hypothetical protein
MFGRDDKQRVVIIPAAWRALTINVLSVTNECRREADLAVPIWRFWPVYGQPQVRHLGALLS